MLGKGCFLAGGWESVGRRERLKVLLAALRDERDKDSAFALVAFGPAARM
jgi:hypothetical protein